MYDFVVVGAGFAGCVLAERIANDLKKKVLVIEKRNHIGGNAYDYYNEDGILVHKYGPHIFHTNNKEVWDYLSRFTEWYYYQHRVLAYVDGMYVPIPINLNTINKLYNTNFTPKQLAEYFEKIKENRQEILNSEDVIVSRVGRELYEKFFKGYTKKQWDLYPSELSPEVTSRVPIRINRDDRYFTDRYQGLPKYGYTRMFEKMLENEKIHIMLKTDYKEVINSIEYGYLIYTGPIDYFFDYKYGKLPYRSLRFEFETLDCEKYQEAGTVNYPNDYDFTRITEFKYLTGQKHNKTTIVREYSAAEGEPYYPILQNENIERYKMYENEANKLKNVFFIGRLANYKYYNMDKVVEQALKLYIDKIRQ
ncbi:UDP-galactopyranose mutase [Caldicoprobacter algeriensis]|uniref:UDP-galactopyranose mutase n=1 Tax=Caldicoprobacter algeriensis TaxID=699281 RepID=UPI00207AD306|nr:UDP-galactopyranose mutase [Caldicoprobacter algeriensis]MCM8901686.1 UDP-galactopyranose mutase [Caldicoprobacter algeriensis]